MSGIKTVRGVCKWFNPAKGFGFANVEGVDQDIFIHYSVIDMPGYKTLAEGQEIEFELVEGPKGPQAQAVRVVIDPSNL
jgi:cold shock protein